MTSHVGADSKSPGTDNRAPLANPMSCICGNAKALLIPGEDRDQRAAFLHDLGRSEVWSLEGLSCPDGPPLIRCFVELWSRSVSLAIPAAGAVVQECRSPTASIFVVSCCDEQPCSEFSLGTDGQERTYHFVARNPPSITQGTAPITGSNAGQPSSFLSPEATERRHSSGKQNPRVSSPFTASGPQRPSRVSRKCQSHTGRGGGELLGGGGML